MPAYRPPQPYGADAGSAILQHAPASPCPLPGAASQVAPQKTTELTDEEQALLLDLSQFVLDVVGFVDPTPTADGLNMAMSMARGDWSGAGISAIGMLPYLGDLAKAPRISRHLAALRRALDLAAVRPAFRAAMLPYARQLARGLDAVRDLFPRRLQVAIDQAIGRIESVFGRRFVGLRTDEALFRAAMAAFTAGLKAMGGPRKVRIALYFGLNKAALQRIQAEGRFVTVLDILNKTPEGVRLLRHLDDGSMVSWRMQEYIWWRLSERVSNLAHGANGRLPAQVFVSRKYYERSFPGGHLPVGQAQAETIYAQGARNRFSGRYEDEIFHKIERPNLSEDVGVRFTALDDDGTPFASWTDRLEGAAERFAGQ